MVQEFKVERGRESDFHREQGMRSVHEMARKGFGGDRACVPNRGRINR